MAEFVYEARCFCRRTIILFDEYFSKLQSAGPHLFETCPSGNFTEYYVSFLAFTIFFPRTVPLCRLSLSEVDLNRPRHT